MFKRTVSGDGGTFIAFGNGCRGADGLQPTTRPRRGGFRQTTNPNAVQDTATGQWYTPQRHAEYAFGVDVSSLKPSEDSGRVFKDTDGTQKSGLAIFKYHGLQPGFASRTCVPPVGRTLPAGCECDDRRRDRCKETRHNLLLDIHYSNSWADPTNEPTPVNWQNISHADRVQGVTDHIHATRSPRWPGRMFCRTSFKSATKSATA